SRIGGISVGMMWGGVIDSQASRDARIERYAAGGGGHAVAFIGYTTRKDPEGRNYLLQVNSWSSRWGDQGWVEWSPAAFEQMLSHRWNVAIGMHSMVLGRNAVRPKIEFRPAA